MSERKPPFVIHIDGLEFKVQETTESGAQLKQLAAKDASYQLFLEERDKNPDKLIGDTNSVTMENGLHFYTMTPATFGS